MRRAVESISWKDNVFIFSYISYTVRNIPYLIHWWYQSLTKILPMEVQSPFLNLYETVILKLWALYFSGNKKDDSSEKRIRHLKISFIILNLLLKQTSLVQDSMDMLCKSKLIYWKAWFSVLVVYCVLDEKACRPLTNITDLNFLSYWHTVFLLHYYMLSLYANDLLFEERNYILNCFLNY